MKPVNQTTFDSHGNCFAAAGASILELPIGGVPSERGTDWLERWRDWLALRDLSIEWFPANRVLLPRGYSILTVEGICKGGHAVVCFDGQVIHDPKDTDLQKAQRARKLHWYVFTLLDPVLGGIRAGRVG